MGRVRRRRGRRRGRPLFVIALRNATFLGLLAVSLVFGVIISRGIVQVSATRPLEGQVIFLDAGHGGIDPGSMRKNIRRKGHCPQSVSAP